MWAVLFRDFCVFMKQTRLNAVAGDDRWRGRLPGVSRAKGAGVGSVGEAKPPLAARRHRPAQTGTDWAAGPRAIRRPKHVAPTGESGTSAFELEFAGKRFSGTFVAFVQVAFRRFAVAISARDTGAHRQLHARLLQHRRK